MLWRTRQVDLSRPLALLGAAVSPSERTLPAHLGDLSPEEWEEFARLAIERHRVAPVVARRLDHLAIPDGARARIDAEVRRNATRTLAHMHALRGILDSLEEIGIRPVVLKGLPLAEALYGAADRRDSGDLDLLIPAEAIVECCSALCRLGYRIDPAHRVRERVLDSRALREECNDLAFVHQTTGIAVELHWRAHHFRAWPDLLSDPREIVVRPSAIGQLRVPSDRANTIYLSLHGALHLWFHMKWLADVAWQARRRGTDGIAEDLELAHRVGAFEFVAVGLRVADMLIGCPVPAELAGAGPRPIETAILSAITEPDASSWQLRLRLLTYLTAFRLSRGIGARVAVARYGAWRPLRLRAAGLRRG